MPKLKKGDVIKILINDNEVYKYTYPYDELFNEEITLKIRLDG